MSIPTVEGQAARGVEDLPGWVRASWLVPLVLGVVMAVLGVALLVNLHAAVATLKWLVVLTLLFEGVEAAATASLRQRPWVGWLSAVVLLAGSVAAVVWPGVTLLVLVLVVGASLLVGGLVSAVASWQLRGEARGWGWGLASGVLSVLLGLFFLLGNPVVAVEVLAIVLAVRVLFSGVLLVGLALGVRALVRT